MMSTEDRDRFTEPFRERRRRGRPRSANPMIPTSISLPADVYEAYCRQSRSEREEHVSAVIRRVLVDAVRLRRIS
jgi:hypothetical protein